jgi:tetratricopeptide (TPR) repeat protein
MHARGKGSRRGAWVRRASFAFGAAMLLVGPAAAEAPEADPPVLPQEALHRATIYVECAEHPARQWSGTGWLLDTKAKLAVTGQRVVRPVATGGPAKGVAVWFPLIKDGQLIRPAEHYAKNARPIRAEVLFAVGRNDLALLRLEEVPADARELPLAGKSPATGDRVFALAGLSDDNKSIFALAQGTVEKLAALAGLDDGRQYWDLKIAMARGQTGGPIVNERGELVAVAMPQIDGQELIAVGYDVESARAFLKKALPMAVPISVDDYANRAMNHVDGERYDSAIRDFSQAMKLDPSRGDLFLGRGAALLRGGDSRTAVGDFDAAMARGAEGAAAYLGRGIAHRELGNHAQSVDDITQVIRGSVNAANDLAAAYTERGITYLREGKHELALADFTRALESNAEHPPAHVHRGAAYLRLGRFAEAAGALDRALSLAGGNAEALQLLGEAEEGMGDYEGALASFENAIRNETDIRRGIVHHRGRVRALRGLERLNEAAEGLVGAAAELETADPNHPVATDLIHDFGVIQGELNHHERAVSAFTEAIKNMPRDPRHYGARGRSLVALGKYDEAVTDLNRAIELREEAEFFAVRGEAWQGLERTEPADADYRRAAALAPSKYHYFSVTGLEIANETPDELTVFVQFYRQDETGRWRWYPDEADEGDAYEYAFPAGQVTFLLEDDRKLVGKRFRVWATGPKKKVFNEYRDQDLVTVVEPGYLANLPESRLYRYTFKP